MFLLTIASQSNIFFVVRINFEERDFFMNLRDGISSLRVTVKVDGF